MTTAADIDLREIIQLIPGYDPVATAGDCVFDEGAAGLALDFFSECLKHCKGAMAGKAFILQPWEQAVVANLFGWKRPDGTRRYREGLVYVPRKNGKTTLAAGIVLFVLFCDGEPGAEIYSAAAEREQASLVFDQAAGMVRQDEDLFARATIYRKAIALKDHSGSYKPISADAHTKHGYNTSFAVVDELHAQPNRELVDVLETSVGARRQPMILHITTADWDRPSICNEKLEYAKKVRDGIYANEAAQRFLPVIYEASTEDDWTDPEVWRRVNPNLGVSFDEEFLRGECQKAVDNPVFENTFKRLYLNVRTEQAVRLIPMAHWDACPCGATLDALKGLTCWGGLDLASTDDTNALCLFFPERHAVVARFWVPEANVEGRELRDNVPYRMWAEQGYMTLTRGSTADQERVYADIVELAKRFHIQSLGYDRWGSQWMSTKLAGAGIEVIEFGQGYQSMSAPTKELLKLIKSHRLDHGGNPVLRWQASVAAGKSDEAESIKPDKSKSSDRIDGIVSLIMGIGCAMADGFEGAVAPVVPEIVWL